MSKYRIEIVRIVWNEEEGVALRIGPDADSLGVVEVRPLDAKSKEWFGDFRMLFPPEMAEEVAAAIAATSVDMRKQ